MAVAGSLWTEGDALHWIDASTVEQSEEGTLVGSPGGTVGSIWIEGDYFHYIDTSGEERRIQGDLIGTPGGAVVGSIWVEGDNLRYIDSSGEERQIAVPAAPTIDCADTCICPEGETAGGCDTLTGCASAGEKHRVRWDHTDCSDAAHHIAIHRSTNGGGFVEVADDVSCDNGDPDAGCCNSGCAACTPDGEYIFTLGMHNETAQTTDYAYKVRVETDSGDVEIDSVTDATCTNCGGDDDCIE